MQSLNSIRLDLFAVWNENNLMVHLHWAKANATAMSLWYGLSGSSICCSHWAATKIRVKFRFPFGFAACECTVKCHRVYCTVCWIKADFYRPQKKLRKGNIFTRVCQEFCPQGGVCQTPPVLGRHPPRQTRQTPPTPLWADTPLGRHPLGIHLPPADSYCSGRYTSYWNAFLFCQKIQRNC